MKILINLKIQYIYNDQDYVLSVNGLEFAPLL